MEPPAGVLEGKNLDSPDESRSFENGRLDVVNIGNVTVGRAVFEPGWQWSKHVKPIAQTESCEVPHVGYVVSGRMGIKMDNGEEREFGPDDAFVIAPGHDGWTVGEEPCVVLDFSGGAEEYAKGS
jgi:quercetin dioxygenase-like cupin family protein